MINREDMLALTRRMTVKRTSMTRIAGGYLDRDGYIDGTFNTGFLKLSLDEKEKNLQIAKSIPFADTNKNLKEYAFSDEKTKGDSMWKLLMGMRACGLKNDALMEKLLVNDISQRETMPFTYFMTDMIFRQKGKIMSVRVNLKKCLNT